MTWTSHDNETTIGHARVSRADTPARYTSPMTEFIPAGSRFVDLPSPFRMKRGGVLHGARMAFETWGELDADGSNAVLILTGLSPDALILRIQPDEGITLRFGAKVPGHSFLVRSATMEFNYEATFVEESPEAYERLLLDALIGDPTLFIRSDEVAQCWRIIDPVISYWADDARPISLYEAASWGPTEADRLLKRDGRAWRNL